MFPPPPDGAWVVGAVVRELGALVGAAVVGVVGAALPGALVVGAKVTAMQHEAAQSSATQGEGMILRSNSKLPQRLALL